MSLIRDLIQSFLYAKKQEGWRYAFNLSIKALTLPFFECHRGFLMRKSLKETFHIPTPKVVVTIRQATVEDIALLETIVPPLRVRRFTRKMGAGEVCMIAISEGKIISFVFAGFADSPAAMEIPFSLGTREAYLWGAYCLPQHRSKDVQTTNTLNLCRWLQDNGYKRAFLLMDKHNKAAIRHAQKMGFQGEAQLITLRILRWRLSRYIPLEQDELCEEPSAFGCR